MNVLLKTNQKEKEREEAIAISMYVRCSFGTANQIRISGNVFNINYVIKFAYIIKDDNIQSRSDNISNKCIFCSRINIKEFFFFSTTQFFGQSGSQLTTISFV